MAGFFKKLFGGAAKAPSPDIARPVAPAPTAGQLIADARAALSRIDGARDPRNWALAQQALAQNLLYAAATTVDHDTVQMLDEADAAISEAIAAAETACSEPERGQMHRIRGDILYRRAQLSFEDDKGRALAEAANAFGAAMDLSPRSADYRTWLDSAFYRGACLQELSAMKGGDQGLAWLDEAANQFVALAAKGGADGGPHPVAAYNAYVVLEQRGRRSPRPEARRYYQEAKRHLLMASSMDTLSKNPDHLKQLLAGLDALIGDTSR